MAAWKAPTIKSKIFLSTEDCVFLSSREYYRGVQRVVGNLIDRVKGLRTRDCLFIENQIMSELPYTDKMHPLRFAFQLLLAEKHFAKHFEQPEKELACKARMQRFFKQHSHFQSKFPGGVRRLQQLRALKDTDKEAMEEFSAGMIQYIDIFGSPPF